MVSLYVFRSGLDFVSDINLGIGGIYRGAYHCSSGVLVNFRYERGVHL